MYIKFDCANLFYDALSGSSLFFFKQISCDIFLYCILGTMLVTNSLSKIFIA